MNRVFRSHGRKKELELVRFSEVCNLLHIWHNVVFIGLTLFTDTVLVSVINTDTYNIN